MFELGNNLREARQQRHIDLVIAEQDTKIRSKYLAALETEEFDVLPGPVFVRGFLRTYSRYLGLDPQLFVDEYNARFGRFEEVDDHSSPALGRPGLAQQRAHRGRRMMRIVAVVSLVALALILWLGLREQPRDEIVDPAPVGSGQLTDMEAPTSETQPGALGTAVAVAGSTATRAPGASAVPETKARSTRSTTTAQQ